MACIYAPTWTDEKFITSFFCSLPKVDEHYLIIGADCNLIQDPSLERSSSNRVSAQVLDTHKITFALLDPRRDKCSSKASSFFSACPSFIFPD